jgi:hypothetical protein
MPNSCENRAAFRRPPLSQPANNGASPASPMRAPLQQRAMRRMRRENAGTDIAHTRRTGDMRPRIGRNAETVGRRSCAARHAALVCVLLRAVSHAGPLIASRLAHCVNTPVLFEMDGIGADTWRLQGA